MLKRKETIDSVIGHNIARLRKGRFNQRQLAEQLNLTQPTMVRIEAGRRPVTVAELGRIAHVLGEPPINFLLPPGPSDRVAFDQNLVFNRLGLVRWWNTPDVDEELRKLQKENVEKLKRFGVWDHLKNEYDATQKKTKSSGKEKK